MREARNHAGVEKEQRKTSKHPFSEERQKDFYPLILSHQPFFWNKRSPPNRSENQVLCQNCDTASQADHLPADEKLFVKKCSLSAILAGNCNYRKDAIQAWKINVSEFSLLCLLKRL
jgi:hypothetical protein